MHLCQDVTPLVWGKKRFSVCLFCMLSRQSAVNGVSTLQQPASGHGNPSLFTQDGVNASNVEGKPARTICKGKTNHVNNLVTSLVNDFLAF